MTEENWRSQQVMGSLQQFRRLRRGNRLLIKLNINSVEPTPGPSVMHASKVNPGDLYRLLRFGRRFLCQIL